MKKRPTINFGRIRSFYAALKIGKSPKIPKVPKSGHFLRDLTPLAFFYKKISRKPTHQKIARFTEHGTNLILGQNCNHKCLKFEIENIWVGKKSENSDFSTRSRTRIEKRIVFLDAPSKTAYQIPNFQIRKVKILGYPRSEMRVGQSLYISIKDCC